MNYKKTKTNFAIAIAKLIARLPCGMILAFGRSIGYFIWIIPNKRKKIAARNIELCFPELLPQQQSALLKKNLLSTGLGFAEMLIAYWSKPQKFISRCEIDGLEHIEAALAQEHGCLLLSCHLHSMELSVKAINLKLSRKGHVLARQHNNKVFEDAVDKARTIHCEKTIDKKDLKTVLKSLKDNRPIFYIPDQNFSYQCQYIDFFKQPAATIVAPARLAQASKVPVIAWFGFRQIADNGKVVWKISIQKPLDYFHESDVTTTLVSMNQLFEQQIRRFPEQYLWVHRRFKNHPKGKNFVYKDL